MHQGQRPYSCVLCSRDFCQSADLERHLETHVNLGPTARTEDELVLYTEPTAAEDVSGHNSHLLEPNHDTYSGCFTLSDQPETSDNTNTTDPWNKNDWNYTEVCSESEKIKEKVFSASQSPNQQPRQDTVTKRKLHQCLICSKHFGSPYKLRRHQLIHTGERPFKCSVCDKAFTQLSHLKLHSQSHCRKYSVKLPGVVSNPSRVQTQNLSAEAYSTQLHGKTAVSCPTRTDAPEVAQIPSLTHTDSLSSEVLHDHVKSPYMVNSVCEIIPASEQHLMLQVKASYAYDDVPSYDQAGKLSDYKDKKSKVSSSPKIGRSTSKGVEHSNFNDSSQMSPTNVEPVVSKILCSKKSDQSMSEIEAQSHLDDNNQIISCFGSKLPKPSELLDAGRKERSPQKGTYKCQTCFKSFLVPSKLHRHMLTHTGQRPFKCHICAKSFRQLCHLKLHLRTRVCLKQSNKTVKRKVKNISHKFPRENGPLTTVSKMFVHSDVNGGKSAAQNYPSFGTCAPALPVVNRVRRRSSDSNQPTSHRTGSHSRYESTNSGQTSENSCSDLPQAIGFNTCRIVHECPVCLKCFSSPSKLKRHCLIHTGQRPFQCYICHRAFRQLAHLKVHYRVHERSGRKTPCLQRQGFKNHHHSRAPTPRQKAFTCNLCGWKFRHQTHLTVHLNNHKNLVGTTPSTVSTLMKTAERQRPMSSVVHRTYEPPKEHASGRSMCTGRTNPDNTLSKTQCVSLTSHIRGIRKNHYSCSVCFKSFDCPTKLQRHSLCHSGLRPLKCLVCSKEFTHRTHLKVHRCLSKERPWIMLPSKESDMACDEVLDCQSQSSNCYYPVNENSLEPDNAIPMEGSSNRDQVNLYTSLKRGKMYPKVIAETTYAQQKTAQTETKQQKGHLCTICQRHFSVPSKLARHLLIHMGIKPFTCQVCGRSFRQLCHLQTHLKVHRKRKLSRLMSNIENSNRQGNAFKPGPYSAPQNNAPLTKNIVTKQNMFQKSTTQIRSLENQVFGEKVGKSDVLPPSKPKKSSTKNSCDIPVKTTVDHGSTSSPSHSIVSGCVTNEAYDGLFVEGEVYSCTPEFANMHPVVHGDQNSNAGAYPENQIFINTSCNNTTSQYKHAPPRRKLPSSSVETQESIRKRANRCSICLKKFDSPSKLARHFLIHMGLKPYKCQVCSKSFRQLCHLQTHRKVHNKNTKSNVPGCTKSHHTNAECASNRPVFDPASHQASPSQSFHVPHMEAPPKMGHYESNQLLVSFVDESGQSEIKSTDDGFDSISDNKQKTNHFMMQQLTLLPSAVDEQGFTDSKQNTSRVSPSQLPPLTHIPPNIKQASILSACATYSITDATLGSTGDVQKAEQCHRVDQSDHLMDKWENTADDEYGFAEGSHIPSTHAAQAQFKEEVVELQFESERVDSRLSKPPNDLLICPDCSQCFTTERKLRTHKCVSKAKQELQRSEGGYQCAICFKSFQVPSKLKRHYVIHTGHRPFQCSVCAKTFTQSTHLKTHLNTHK